MTGRIRRLVSLRRVNSNGAGSKRRCHAQPPSGSSLPNPTTTTTASFPVLVNAELSLDRDQPARSQAFRHVLSPQRYSIDGFAYSGPASHHFAAASIMICTHGQAQNSSFNETIQLLKTTFESITERHLLAASNPFHAFRCLVDIAFRTLKTVQDSRDATIRLISKPPMGLDAKTARDRSFKISCSIARPQNGATSRPWFTIQSHMLPVLSSSPACAPFRWNTKVNPATDDRPVHNLLIGWKVEGEIKPRAGPAQLSHAVEESSHLDRTVFESAASHMNAAVTRVATSTRRPTRPDAVMLAVQQQLLARLRSSILPTVLDLVQMEFFWSTGELRGQRYNQYVQLNSDGTVREGSDNSASTNSKVLPALETDSAVEAREPSANCVPRHSYQFEQFSPEVIAKLGIDTRWSAFTDKDTAVDFDDEFIAFETACKGSDEKGFACLVNAVKNGKLTELKTVSPAYLKEPGNDRPYRIALRHWYSKPRIQVILPPTEHPALVLETATVDAPRIEVRLTAFWAASCDNESSPKSRSTMLIPQEVAFLTDAVSMVIERICQAAAFENAAQAASVLAEAILKFVAFRTSSARLHAARVRIDPDHANGAHASAHLKKSVLKPMHNGDAAIVVQAFHNSGEAAEAQARDDEVDFEVQEPTSHQQRGAEPFEVSEAEIEAPLDSGEEPARQDISSQSNDSLEIQRSDVIRPDEDVLVDQDDPLRTPDSGPSPAKTASYPLDEGVKITEQREGFRNSCEASELSKMQLTHTSEVTEIRKEHNQSHQDQEHLEVLHVDDGQQASSREQQHEMPEKFEEPPQPLWRQNVVLALGSNVGDRFKNIEDACDKLDACDDIRIVETSPLYETEPMYVEDQGRFLNGVCAIETTLRPMELLDRLQAIENDLGRVKFIDKGPRNIDLDIVAYDQEVVDNERLTIPHRLMNEREFVLRPFTDLTTMLEWRHPIIRRTAAEQQTMLPEPDSSMTPVTPLAPTSEPLRALDLSCRTQIMSILNVTPDSFSDGGMHAPTDVEALKATVKSHIAAGATIIDIGGQSSRPNAPDITADEEIARVLPAIQVIKALPEAANITISIDTYRAAVAEAAINAGAHVVNDVSAGLLDPEMLSTIARLKCTYIMMHMRGTPATMQSPENTSYPSGVLVTVRRELISRLKAAQRAGIRRWRLILDPGFGFAKTLEQNLELLRELPGLRKNRPTLTVPWLVGTSRKGFIGKVTGTADAAARVGGTAATVARAVQFRADIVRVHDVEIMRQVVRMTEALDPVRARWDSKRRAEAESQALKAGIVDEAKPAEDDQR